HQGRREIVPGEDLERRGRHDTRRLGEPFEKRQNARTDIAPVPPGPDRRGAREEMEVVGLGRGEPQRVRDPGEDLARRTWRPALLEPYVVLGGDVREHRDLLAAEPRRPSPR